jgi:uncharacterized protein YecE (DUF72 family)
MEQMPPAFRFCPKVPKTISHEGKLMDNVERAHEFIDIMSQLGTRLGPMFLQLPPRYSPKLLGDLQAFLARWPREVRLAVEVRHLDWFDDPYDESLNQLLTEYNMARVTIDTRPIRDLSGDKLLAGSVYQSLLEARERKPDVPVVPKRTSDFTHGTPEEHRDYPGTARQGKCSAALVHRTAALVFVRYIGHPEMKVNDPYLKEWGEHFISQLREDADVYMFCHSPNNLAAPWLCRKIYAQVQEQVALPPLPWEAVDSENYEQGQLF